MLFQAILKNKLQTKNLNCIPYFKPIAKKKTTPLNVATPLSVKIKTNNISNLSCFNLVKISSRIVIFNKIFENKLKINFFRQIYLKPWNKIQKVPPFLSDKTKLLPGFLELKPF
eukprot:TRINITY_DN21192_c0_g2_i1.p2 TRINITY_DN21192_c0_g2~~TRINITY_DN21192_c0_g2_i1.p2  ORF type:complete len:114 (+),score=4.88 TRINITY_DN21192_c0_g2_i1:468-809(+)